MVKYDRKKFKHNECKKEMKNRNKKTFWHRWDSNPRPVLVLILQCFLDLHAESSRLHLEEESHYFAAKNLVGGLGPWVSAPPMGPTDLFENYIFEISMKN